MTMDKRLERYTLLTATVLTLAALFIVILWFNHGHFIYTLDDPYIHLTLAEQLAHGHYGLNENEFASPASTVLWPFLLVPFMALPWAEFIPLVINSVCCLLTALLLLRILQHSYARCAGILAFALLLCTNGFGLVFMGMEHSLQLLLALAITSAMLDLVEGRSLPKWLLAALIIAPLVRYELLGFSFGAVVLLLLHRRYRYLMAVPIIVTILGAFSFYLWQHTGDWLPASVVAKLGTKSAYLNTLIIKILLGIVSIFTLCFWRDRKRLLLCGWMVALLLAHMLVGKNGWFSRYEIYVLLPAVLMLIYYMPNLMRRPIHGLLMAALLPVLLLHYVYATLAVPGASHRIYNQQVQMQRLLKLADYPPVAVNDIGYVSYRNPAYVLDLWGLGDRKIQMLRQADDAHWMEKITKEHDVHLVMLYPVWYKNIPGNWVYLGTLKQLPFPGLIDKLTGAMEVDFYVTDTKSRKWIAPMIEQWKQGLSSDTRWIEQP